MAADNQTPTSDRPGVQVEGNPASGGHDDVTQRGCCVLCDEAFRESLTENDLRRWHHPFVVCATCGNKRCPKATDHRLGCTRSNEPGQPGSVHTADGGPEPSSN